MKYCVIGSGGREHALAWRLLYDGSAREVYVLPGNGGIEEKYCASIPATDFPAISSFCIEKKIDVVVVGPEIPLVEGIVDYLNGEKIPVFGPKKHAAELEGSKLFAKMIMQKYGVPTAGCRQFLSRGDLIQYIHTTASYPAVIKLDGLAAGKGVGVVERAADAMKFIEEMVPEGARVFVEDYLDGEEASVLGISDGTMIIPLIAAQDHKRAYDGDNGPNTGGMGAYSPAPIMDEDKMNFVREHVFKPVINGMQKEGKVFKGILYAGLMIKGDSIKVLEFNTRFGDPETQVILPLLKNKLGDLISASIEGTLHRQQVNFHDKYALSVVMASAGYPGNYQKGKIIHGIEQQSDHAIIFHAGTARRDGNVYTNGGRVLNVTGIGKTFAEAREAAYEMAERISFEGACYRKDIGHRALKYFR